MTIAYIVLLALIVAVALLGAYVARNVELYPVCPACGKSYYIKTMPLHLQGHTPDELRQAGERMRANNERRR